MTAVLQSYIAGRWQGSKPAQQLRSAINGKPVASTHAEALDFGEALHHARTVGLPNLLKLDFQQRAAILKALAKYLNDHKEALYAVSAHTGATRQRRLDRHRRRQRHAVRVLQRGRATSCPRATWCTRARRMPLGKKGGFAGTHILVPRRGVAVHINAFNFPVWGLLEKFAPSFLAGMPCIGKPATATSYLTEALVRLIEQSGLLPEGALQLVIGGTGDLLDRLDGNDVVTFTGSADTAAKLRVHPNIVQHSIPFNAEADSLNCAILAPDVAPDDEEFDLFVKEVAREMTVKAGQKCTAIRRAIVPRAAPRRGGRALRARLAKTVVGDPANENVRMGALASHAQRKDVAERVAELSQNAELVFGAKRRLRAGGRWRGRRRVLRAHAAAGPRRDEPCRARRRGLRPGEHADAVRRRRRSPGAGRARPRQPGGHAGHARPGHRRIDRAADRGVARPPAGARPRGGGRVHRPRLAAAAAQARRPGPRRRRRRARRRARGEALPAARRGAGLAHHDRRRDRRVHARRRAARVRDLHPFRKHFEDLQIGDSLLTHRRTVSEADIVAFGGISGDYFYMHFDEIAAKESPFGKRIAHGYFVLCAAAGLFVSPAPGPVLANYGLDTLRFVKPVGIGDTIQARLTCKRKIDRNRKDAKGVGQGVVAWDVEVTNQDGEMVASYDILTLVAKKG